MTNEQIHSLIKAVANIANGDAHGANGLEALTMAIGGIGDPGATNVASSLDAIAHALQDASEEVGSAIRTSTRNDALANAIIYLADKLEEAVSEATERLVSAIEFTVP